ncbi:hypothetical protein J4G37_30080 [Microvirga sp. 3-52]|nr:hypothetical protein [Microvirga sp. 3-52]
MSLKGKNTFSPDLSFPGGAALADRRHYRFQSNCDYALADWLVWLLGALWRQG